MTAMLIVWLEGVAADVYTSRFDRVSTNFSSEYLRRNLAAMAQKPPNVLFLGDSVLWGYNLETRQSAVAILTSEGCACENLSFKASSPPNYYALVRLMEEYGVRPRLVVLEVNQAVLTKANQAYAKLHPAVAELAAPLLTAADRRELGLKIGPKSVSEQLSDVLAAIALPYALRADLRDRLIPTPDAPPPKHPSADMFFAEYDLTPLNSANLGVQYLAKTVAALHRDEIPTVAFMTPTNHELLHEYIDGPEYQQNVDYLTRLLSRAGVRVLNLDRAFSEDNFYDSVHLKPKAQHRFAELLHESITDAGIALTK